MVRPEESSIQEKFDRRLEEVPEGRAIAFPSSDGYRWLTYADFHQEAAAMATLLRQRGLAPGEVCVLALPSDRLSATALLGVFLNGALPVLVAPPVVRGLHSNLRDVLLHVMRRSAARMLVTEEEWRLAGEDLASVGRPAQLIAPGDLEGGDSAAFRPVLPAAGDRAALQLTSGTTGFPRLCMWRQDRVLSALRGMVVAMELGEDDVCLNWTPLYHDMGLVNNFLLCLAHRVPLVMMPTFDFLTRPGGWLRLLWQMEATTTWSPNFGFALAARKARERDLESVDLSGVKAFWNAAEKIHLETYVRFHERFRSLGVTWDSLKTNFGCAENVGGATFSDPHGPLVAERVDTARLYEDGVAEPVEEGSEGEAVDVVGAGKGHPNLRIHILSPDGERLPDGVVGEVALETPSRMLGYLGDEDETAAAFHGEWVKTGDLGYLRNGELFWVGRAKERINLHGKKYDPSDFEAPLFGVEGLRAGCFAAFGVADPEEGTEKLVIVSELRKDTDRSVEEMVAEVREKVAREIGVHVGEVLLVPQGSMTKTSSGKRRHTHYRRLYREGRLESLATPV